MTGKEIITRAMKFEETPRLPVAVLDGYAWILDSTGKSFQDLFDMKNGAQFITDQFNLLQSDIVYSNGHVFNVVHRVLGGEVRFDGIGESVEITKHPFTEITDFKNFNVAEIMEKSFESAEYQATIQQSKELVELAGKDKIVSSVGYAPFSVAGMLVGVQDFMAALYDDEEETLGLIDFAADLVISNAEKFVASGVETVFVADPVASGDLISPSGYEKFALPALKKVCAAFHSRGIPVLCHICGSTEKRLQPLLDSGIQAFSVDATDIEIALGVARGHYTMMGNLSPFDVLMSKTAQEVREIGNTLAKKAGNSGGYIMMPGCDLAPKTPLENIQAMVAAAHHAFE